MSNAAERSLRSAAVVDGFERRGLLVALAGLTWVLFRRHAGTRCHRSSSPCRQCQLLSQCGLPLRETVRSTNHFTRGT